MSVVRDRRMRIGVLVSLLVLLATCLAAVGYARSLPAEYTATAVLQFSPRPTKNGGVVGGETVASTAAGYVAYMGAPATLQRVATEVDTLPATLKDGLTVTLLPTTTTVSVDYTAPDPAAAAEGANAMADAAVARAKSDALVTAAELAPAAEPINPSGPQRLAIVAAGLLLGLLLAALVLVILVVLPSRRHAIAIWLDPEDDEAVAPELPRPADLPPPRPDEVRHA